MKLRDGLASRSGTADRNGARRSGEPAIRQSVQKEGGRPSPSPPLTTALPLNLIYSTNPFNLRESDRHSPTYSSLDPRHEAGASCSHHRYGCANVSSFGCTDRIRSWSNCPSDYSAAISAVPLPITLGLHDTAAGVGQAPSRVASFGLQETADDFHRSASEVDAFKGTLEARDPQTKPLTGFLQELATGRVLGNGHLADAEMPAVIKPEPLSTNAEPSTGQGQNLQPSHDAVRRPCSSSLREIPRLTIPYLPLPPHSLLASRRLPRSSSSLTVIHWGLSTRFTLPNGDGLRPRVALTARRNQSRTPHRRRTPRRRPRRFEALM